MLKQNKLNKFLAAAMAKAVDLLYENEDLKNICQEMDIEYDCFDMTVLEQNIYLRNLLYDKGVEL